MSEPKFKIVLCWVKSEEYNEIHPYLVDEVVSSDLDYDAVRERYEQITNAIDNAGIWIE